MSWSINETLEQRKMKKPLGYTKYHLNKKLNIPLSSIKLDPKKQTVKVRQQVVAKSGGSQDDYGIIFMGEAAEVKSDVKASMAAWLAKMDPTE